MKYFDDFEQMQRIFREVNAAHKIYEELDIARKLALPTLFELKGALGQTDLSLSLSLPTQFQIAVNSYLETQNDTLTEVLEGPLRQASLELGQINSSMQELARRSFEDFSRATAIAAREVLSAYDLAQSVGLDKLTKELNESLAQQVQAAASPILSMLAGELLSSAAVGSLSSALVGGFGADLLDYISRAEEVDSEEEIAGFLQAFLKWLLEQAGRLPGTKLSAGAIFNIFLTVATLIYGQYSSDRAEVRLKEEIHEEGAETRDEILEQMHKMEELLAEELSDRIVADANRKEFIVIKNANLRKGPGEQFESAQILPPNLLVEEIGREGEWVHIEFFDYVKGEAREGWISSTLLVEKDDEEMEPVDRANESGFDESAGRMHATITLDGELAEKIERLSQEKSTSFEVLAEAALREGLERLGQAAPSEEHGRTSYTRPVSLGGYLVESLDDISGALAAAEGEAFK